jgi:hypothetical protein
MGGVVGMHEEFEFAVMSGRKHGVPIDTILSAALILAHRMVCSDQSKRTGLPS